MLGQDARREAETLVGDAKKESDASPRADPARGGRPRGCRREGRRRGLGGGPGAVRRPAPARPVAGGAGRADPARRDQAAHKRMQADLRVGPDGQRRPASAPADEPRGAATAAARRRRSADHVRARPAASGRIRSRSSTCPRGSAATADPLSPLSPARPAAWPWPSTRLPRRLREPDRAGRRPGPVSSATSGCDASSPTRTVLPSGVTEVTVAGSRLLGRARRRVGRPQLQAHLPRVDGHGDGPVGRVRAGHAFRRRRARPRSGRARPAGHAGQHHGAREARRRTPRRAPPPAPRPCPTAPRAPQSMTATRSASSAASSKSWVTSSTGTPAAASSDASSRSRAGAGAGVERRQRLVQQQRQWARGRARAPAPRAGARRPTGARAWRRRALPSRTGRAAHAHGAAAPRACRPHAVGHVAPRAEVREQRVVLKQVARARAARAGRSTPDRRVEPDLRRRSARAPRVGPKQAGDDPQQRSSCPRPTAPRARGSGPRRHVRATSSAKRAEPGARLKLEHRPAHGRRPRASRRAGSRR